MEIRHLKVGKIDHPYFANLKNEKVIEKTSEIVKTLGHNPYGIREKNLKMKTRDESDSINGRDTALF